MTPTKDTATTQAITKKISLEVWVSSMKLSTRHRKDVARS